MKTKAELEAMLDGTDPHDGLRAEEVVVGKEHSLFLVFRSGGVMAEMPGLVLTDYDPQTGLLIRTMGDSDVELGTMDRLKLAMAAMCRYINTGGNGDALRAMASIVANAAEQCVAKLPGFELIESKINDEGAFEHLFAALNEPNAIRWVEDQFFDVVSMNDLRNQAQQAELDAWKEVEDDAIDPQAPESGDGVDRFGGSDRKPPQLPPPHPEGL